VHLVGFYYKNILYMFRTNNCSSSGGYFCTRSIQYFTMHLWGVWLLTRCDWGKKIEESTNGKSWGKCEAL